MTPGQQRRKDLQDEMREYQRMEDALREMTERNNELEAEAERLRERLYNIWKISEQHHHPAGHRLMKIVRQVPDELSEYNALSGGGDESQ